MFDDIKKDIEKQIEFDSNFKHIGYDDKISRAYDELLNTDPKKIIKRGWKERDNTLGGIYGGKIYIVGGSTGIGKSTFVNQICNNVSKQNYRVVKYSLEDRMEDIGKEEIFYTTNRIRKSEGKKGYFWVDFVNGELNKDKEFQEYTMKACNMLIKNNNLVELDKTKQVSINDLVQLMEKECKMGAKLFAIDHLHYFDMDGNERHDLQIQNVMHRINEITRKYNVAVILVAHYRKGSNNEIPDLDEFKDGSAIKHVGNIIIQITRDEDMSRFHITKMRGPLKPDIIETTFNLSTFEYAFTKTDAQRKKEKEFI